MSTRTRGFLGATATATAMALPAYLLTVVVVLAVAAGVNALFWTAFDPKQLVGLFGFLIAVTAPMLVGCIAGMVAVREVTGRV